MCKVTEALSLISEQNANPSLDPALVLRAAQTLLLEALAENQPKTMSLTHERLLEVLRYDPRTGNFYWRSGCRRALQAGSIRTDGYRVIEIDGVKYRAARLAWFYNYGAWPENEVDHINQIKDDNRVKNLRDVTGYANARNSKFRNPWGCPGVTETAAGTFLVRFRVDGRARSFGTYDDQYDAVKVCKAQRRALGVELG